MNTDRMHPIVTGPWMVVNDDVMGGVSESLATADDGTLAFTGRLSLENNGGFASTRAPIEPLPRGTTGIRFEARGDGRSYQLRLRPGRSFDGVAWRANFETTPDRWRLVEVPLAEFEPVFRGRLVRGQPALGIREIGQLGFLLADRKPGPFALSVRGLAAWRA